MRGSSITEPRHIEPRFLPSVKTTEMTTGFPCFVVTLFDFEHGRGKTLRKVIETSANARPETWDEDAVLTVQTPQGHVYLGQANRTGAQLERVSDEAKTRSSSTKHSSTKKRSHILPGPATLFRGRVDSPCRVGQANVGCIQTCLTQNHNTTSHFCPSVGIPKPVFFSFWTRSNTTSRFCPLESRSQTDVRTTDRARRQV